MFRVAYNTWVKNVYNMGIEGGITRGYFSPLFFHSLYMHIKPADNSLFLPSFIPLFITLISTAIRRRLYLLITTYSQFPQPLLLLQPKKY